MDPEKAQLRLEELFFFQPAVTIRSGRQIKMMVNASWFVRGQHQKSASTESAAQPACTLQRGVLGVSALVPFFFFCSDVHF